MRLTDYIIEQIVEQTGKPGDMTIDDVIIVAYSEALPFFGKRGVAKRLVFVTPPLSKLLPVGHIPHSSVETVRPDNFRLCLVVQWEGEDREVFVRLGDVEEGHYVLIPKSDLPEKENLTEYEYIEALLELYMGIDTDWP